MRWIVLGLTTTALLAGCSAWRVDKAARVASGYISHTLCSGHFVSGFSAEQMFEETVRHKRGLSTVHALLGYRVDDAHHEVHATVAGGFDSVAVYRDGLGCTLRPEGETLAAVQAPPALASTPPLLPDIAGPAVVAPSDPAMAQAIEHVFHEPFDRPTRHVKAVLVRLGHSEVNPDLFFSTDRLLGEVIAALHAPR